MQTNTLLSAQTVASVDARVDKILKDLGNPKPPISLEDVRRLLKLDLGYYSTGDTGWLNEKIHQLRVAGKQILSEPSTILAVTKRLGLKGMLLTERRRILLDTDEPKAKLRWNEAHEITHDILPWHDGVAHGDPEATLSPSCHEQIEAEANYGAGRLLFCGSSFIEIVRDSSVSFDLVKTLQKLFGNTMMSTFWRVVESTHHCAFGIVSVHPWSASGDPTADIRYFVRSPKFAAQYRSADPDGIFDIVSKHCRGRKGPIGNGVFLLADDRDDSRPFTFETFWNGHDALTLGHYP